MSQCNSVKQTFKEWKSLKENILQSLKTPVSLLDLWSRFPQDPQCQNRSLKNFILQRSYVCSACQEIDHLNEYGCVPVDERFQIDHPTLPHTDFYLQKYPDSSPSIKIGKRIHLQVDPVTKQYLIGLWLEDRIPDHVRKVWWMYHCGGSMYILKEDEGDPILSTKLEEEDIYQIIRQIQCILESIPGFLHGKPLLSSIKFTEHPSKIGDHSFDWTLTLDDFERSRLYLPTIQIYTTGHSELRRPSEVRGWIQLTDTALYPSFREMNEYTSSMDMYGFVISLAGHSPEKFFGSDRLRDLWDWMFKAEQREEVKLRVQEIQPRTMADLREVLEDIWIRSSWNY